MVVVADVTKFFPGRAFTTSKFPWRKSLGVYALRDVSLIITKGELFGLLGVNGAGKTTLLKLLATLLLPSHGTLTIDGFDAVTDPLQAKRRIGLCPSDERSFYFRLSARANLEFFGRLVGLRGNALDRRISEVVALVGASDFVDRRFDVLSSGMRQRLSIARALLSDPEILILDEPTRAVDPVHAAQLRELIRDELVARRGKTVVLATNQLDEAWRLCDRVAIMSQGRIVALGPPRSLQLERQRVLRYHLTMDRMDVSMLERTRALPGLIDLQVLAQDCRVEVDVTIHPTDGSITALLRALSSNGTVLRDFRSVDVEPLEVFAHFSAPTDHG